MRELWRGVVWREGEMAAVFEITIAADGDVVERVLVREQYGIDALSGQIATHVARWRREIWAARSATITIEHREEPALAELPAGGGYDDDVI